jgi:tRNA modification GTPase
MRDTIFALSSGAPPAGVAIIRASGPGVRFGLETLSGCVPAPRVARFGNIRDRDGKLLDRGLVLFFPAPHSFTGEDVAEFHVHGSRASVAAVLAALNDMDGFRQAEPGEFTRQAFDNGRMDLTAIEGLSDLIRAETDSQRSQALFQAEGGLRNLYQDWAKRLTRARAMIEAELDFADEEDVPGSIADQIWSEMDELMVEIKRHLSMSSAAEIVRQGYRIALIGPPNTGKSSLLNYLAQRDVAIVSDTPGTTRDVLETRLDLDGRLVVIQDTAGLRESVDAVEVEGIRRSMLVARQADLILDLQDIDKAQDVQPDVAGGEFEDKCVRVWTKADKAPGKEHSFGVSDLAISTVTGKGIESLLALISRRLDDLESKPDDGLPTRPRHVALLKQAVADIESAMSMVGAPVEVRAECLRQAGNNLGKITGTVDVENLLGVIFSEFCVGK